MGIIAQILTVTEVVPARVVTFNHQNLLLLDGLLEGRKEPPATKTCFSRGPSEVQIQSNPSLARFGPRRCAPFCLARLVIVQTRQYGFAFRLFRFSVKSKSLFRHGNVPP